ncbi:MAG: hypothetical protein ACP5SH_16755, partial [Syntrophobacteraceae bacterium]
PLVPVGELSSCSVPGIAGHRPLSGFAPYHKRSGHSEFPVCECTGKKLILEPDPIFARGGLPIFMRSSKKPNFR